MALDTGPMGSTFNGADVAAGGDPYAGVEPDADPVTVESLVFAPGQTFGEGLKAGREFLGLDLQSVADATKIRSHYLAALEAMDLAQLPSRPFILGYVRAYARVLGVDDEQAIARFRQDAPDLMIRRLADPDTYAKTGWTQGFPMADGGGRAWLTHCYGMVGAGRDLDADSGGGGELYVVIGHAPQRQACADAARTLFHEVAEAWRTRGWSGQALYAFACERAEAMGWRFNHATKGHRVGDFPHSIHKGGDLVDLPATPSSGLWILEIQIAHPTEPFGAFYEDLLS